MIRTRAQLTDPDFRERMGYEGTEPVHLLELPGLNGRWGVHIEHQPDPHVGGRDYFINTGETRVHLTKDELVAMAVDVLTRLDGGTLREEWAITDKAGNVYPCDDEADAEYYASNNHLTWVVSRRCYDFDWAKPGKVARQ